MNLLSIVGRKGSGKSGVLTDLIGILSQRSYRVGVLKRMARVDLEIDEPGTDTYRYRMEGAGTVILAGKRRLALFSNLTDEMPLETLLNHFQGFDLVFLEGYDLEGVPKVEVVRKDAGPDQVAAMVSDTRTDPDRPHFGFNQLEHLAAYIEEKFLKKEPEASLS